VNHAAGRWRFKLSTPSGPWAVRNGAQTFTFKFDDLADGPLHLPDFGAVMRDFSPVPELALLERCFWAPPAILAASMYLLGGLPWFVWGFCLPTMTLAHSTFAINTVNHMFGSRRFETVDESRNNPVTAFFAVGEGWHNNHHRFQRAARNGFYWWEFDVTWYTIKAMEAVGLAWDLQAVPARIYEEARAVKAQRAARAVPSVVDAA